MSDAAAKMRVSDAIFRVTVRERDPLMGQPVDVSRYVVFTSAEPRDGGWISVTYHPVPVAGHGSCAWGSMSIPGPGTVPRPFGPRHVKRTGRTLAGLRTAQRRDARWPDGRFKQDIADTTTDWLELVPGANAIAIR